MVEAEQFGGCGNQGMDSQGGQVPQNKKTRNVRLRAFGPKLKVQVVYVGSNWVVEILICLVMGVV